MNFATKYTTKHTFKHKGQSAKNPHIYGDDISAPILHLRDITIMRGSRQILHGLNLSAHGGEAWVIKGDNGAGKTSLLRLIAGLLPVASGKMTFSPGNTTRASHYLGHADGLKGVRLVGEELAYQTALYPRAKAMPDLLTRLGLEGREAMAVADLSAGYKKRLTFARLLIAPRPIWLLDEPMTALDAKGRGLIENLVRGHIAANGLVLAASHTPLDFATHELTLLMEGAKI